jgi:hypothetical protein
MTKIEAINISDKITNFNCPISWYKHGEFKMSFISE